MRTVMALFARLFGVLRFLAGLADFGFQLGLELVGPLVLGDLGKHHLEACQLVFRRRRPAVLLLGLEIRRR